MEICDVSEDLKDYLWAETYSTIDSLQQVVSSHSCYLKSQVTNSAKQ